MIKLNLKLSPDISADRLKTESALALGLDEAKIKALHIAGRSLDARRGRPPFFLWTLHITLCDTDEAAVAEKNAPFCTVYEPTPPYKIPDSAHIPEKRPVVVGFGPAGIFASLLLAEKGFRPIIIERGGSVESRIKAVDTFFAEKKLNTECNIQFGEGGAGTFSDGKLGTLISDRSGRIDFVLKTFARFGAGDELTYMSKPHIGTDVLRTTVSEIRKYIISLGGKFHFNTKVTDLIIENGKIKGVLCGERVFDADAVFLAIGHSARDTFVMLHSRGLPMEKKPFAIGVRIEHLQENIDSAMYHGFQKRFQLPKADYKLSYHTKSGRGVYTFCMCPGGVVVPACSEEGGMVTNGMSFRARNERNANSALLVSIAPNDVFGGLFAGIELQRTLEQKAFVLGGGDYSAPAQTVGDFMLGRPSTGFGAVMPSCPTGARPTNLVSLLPKVISASIAEALPEFGNKIKGFDSDEAVLTAIESRSTCPIRILRDECSMQSAVGGIYPIGEGAGYAGGITSAAVDGMKAAEKYIQNA